MRDLLHGALCPVVKLCSTTGLSALLITAACGGGDPPGGGNGNGDTDGGGMMDRGENPTDDGPTGTCEWDETEAFWPFPRNPEDPMADPDCNPLIRCINEDDDDHRWRDVSRDDGMPLEPSVNVVANAREPACAHAYRGERFEIRHAPGDACVEIRNGVDFPMVLSGDRLSLDVTSDIEGQTPVDFVAEGLVLDNGTRMRYTLTLTELDRSVDWTFEIERLPLPPGVTTSEHCLPPP